MYKAIPYKILRKGIKKYKNVLHKYRTHLSIDLFTLNTD